MLTIGIDLGTSFIKVCLYDNITGYSKTINLPEKEMTIQSPQHGWAEQDPDQWWDIVSQGIHTIFEETPYSTAQVTTIGISYQMHGLIVIDEDLQALRPAIIWCDSRTQEESEILKSTIGAHVLQHELLNDPGNFTLSKLLWIKRNEPDVYKKIFAFMLPGDFIAMKLSGKPTTTPSGLSEGTMWDFKHHKTFTHWKQIGLEEAHVPEIVPNFTDKLIISEKTAENFGFNKEVRISYRAGDQINNGYFMQADSAGTAVLSGGTSGVIYALNEGAKTQMVDKFNTFLHVEPGNTGISAQLLCINSMAISYRWVKDNLFPDVSDYETLNQLVMQTDSSGLMVFPFGNVSERIFGNQATSASIRGLHFNQHKREHILSAFFESLIFVFNYSLDLLKDRGTPIKKIHLSPGGVFQSAYFIKRLSDLTGVPIHVMAFNGATGAAKGAAIGIDPKATQTDLPVATQQVFVPEPDRGFDSKYACWKRELDQMFD